MFVNICECVCVFSSLPALVLPPQVDAVQGAAAGPGTAGVRGAPGDHAPALQHRGELRTLAVQGEGVAVQTHVPQAA